VTPTGKKEQISVVVRGGDGGNGCFCVNRRFLAFSETGGLAKYGGLLAGDETGAGKGWAKTRDEPSSTKGGELFRQARTG